MFAHLHNHSEYSLLDGLSRLSGITRRAAELKMPAVALTDHGNVHGAVEFHKAAKAAGVKPIIGVEGYVAAGSRTSRDPNERSPYHLTVLAQTQAGYRNLLKLVSLAHLEGFYYRPRFDRESLQKHNEGLIVLSGCPSAEVSRRLSEGRPDAAGEAAGWYGEVFKGRYYIELMRHEGVPGLDEINRGLIEVSRKGGLPVVVTNDTHYVHREDAPLQDLLTCIQTNTNLNDPKRLKFDADSFYLKSAEEMQALWPEAPDGLKNSLVIAEQCDAGPEFGRTLVPRFVAPGGAPSMQYLRQLCADGAAAKFGRPAPREVMERLEYELSVVEKTNFADYFLVVWDIFRFVNQKGILSAVRGSAAASLVLYCLDVTQINPLATRLVFERFLNLERKEMPDIDMDFQDDRRAEVIRHCVERYGREHVAQIITFGTLGAKAAVRDVARALGYEVSVGDNLARRVPWRLNMTLDSALEESAELSSLVRDDEKSARVMDLARKLEGAVRHASTHAAGVVISEEPLTNYVALQRSTSGDDDAPPTTQFAMGPVADVGLLKMDFLGLTNLTILDRAMAHVRERRGETIELANIPADATHPMAKAAYELLSAAETFGVFQLESAGMRRYIKDLKPNSVGDVAAMIALYRPGPMEHITTFIEAKHGRSPIRYPHPALKEILDETYGVIVYQDQVLLIAREFGGYTLGEADILRKAMGKKIPEVMATQREKFIAGAAAKGYTVELATTIFNLIEPFAGYAFNKAHSVSYAMIAYWTAYFKANYPVEFWTAVLNAFSASPEKVGESVREARRQDVRVLGPDVSHSRVEFSIESLPDGQWGVRFGLAAIKNVGAAAIAPVVAARQSGGAFKSISDFCARVDLRGTNRRTLESLIKAGALDGLGPRAALVEAAERITVAGQKQAKSKASGQASMFDGLAVSAQLDAPMITIGTGLKESEQERAAWERELLGVEMTQSAFDREMASQPEHVVVYAANLTAERAGERVSVLGQVAAVRELATRKGERFLAVSLGLFDGPVELVVWPNVLASTEALWTAGKYVSADGVVRERDGRISVSVDAAAEYQFGSGASHGAATPSGLPAEASAGEDDLDRAPGNGQHAELPARAATTTAAEAKMVQNALNGNQHRETGTAPAAVKAQTADRAANGNGQHTKAVAAPPASGAGNGNGLAPVVVRIRETGQAEQDRYTLEDVIRTLLEHRGPAKVMLTVRTRDRLVKLDLQFVSVDPCEALRAKLMGLLGPDAVDGMPAGAPGQ
jgi:DNA polymerase-3 subunit alpha